MSTNAERKNVTKALLEEFKDQVPKGSLQYLRPDSFTHKLKVDSVTELIGLGLIDKNNPDLMAALENLYLTLQSFMAENGKKKASGKK